MKRPALGVIALACFGIGSVLMLVFEHVLTRIVGMGALFAFIVAGVFAIASPELLDADEELP